jgi:glycerol-3-phosphate acyltransferase PlsY
MSLARVSGAAALGYLLGTFPTADLVARRVSGGTVDLRTVGSGNPGGANAHKMLGRRAGYTVMAGDIAKGTLGSVAGRLVAGSAGAHAAGTAAVIGHCLPVWNGGRGGKGVATTVGQCLATFPAYFPIDLAVAAATASNPRLKHRAFTATMVASACWIGGSVLWWRRGWRNLWGPRPDAGLPLSAAISSGMVAYKFIAASRSAARAVVDPSTPIPTDVAAAA